VLCVAVTTYSTQINSCIQLPHLIYETTTSRSHSLETFEGTIKVFEDFIGSGWLNAQPVEASPLTEIWNRTDHLASLELFTVADSYVQIAPRAVPRWMDEYKKAVKTHKVKDILSQTYELISAAMFRYEHEVSLCEIS
jgi:hypothetical protein